MNQTATNEQSSFAALRRAPAWVLSPTGAVLLGLVAGAVAFLAGARDAGDAIWAVTTAAVLVVSVLSVSKQLLRGKFGVDFIAVLAMLGALLLGEFLAGAIIAVMLTGGGDLERFALARAKRELRALLERAPHSAHRRRAGLVEDVPIDQVGVGDVLLVKAGEVVPVDGVICGEDDAVLDESALTGEARPARFHRGEVVRSGGTNVGGAFELRVTKEAARSTYAGIIRLVRAAEESKAPSARMADRYALVFLGVTLALAALAWWLSGNAERALSVLVVATPCPLILAAPAAIMSGVSRAARHGIVIKGGGPLEKLAEVRNLLLDKTGTLTMAKPQVVAVQSFGALSPDEIVHFAAAVELLSVHPFAPVIVAEAQSRRLEPSFPADVQEQMGAGLRGQVDGREVAVGQLAYVCPGGASSREVRAIEIRTAVEGSSSVFVAVDGELAGAILMQDTLRPEAPRAIRALRGLGMRRVSMVTGDHPDVADLVGDAVGVDRVFAERTPKEKVDVVRKLLAEGPTAMVGDGINDAPALATADVGIAMGARGATAASEAADVVLMGDRFDSLVRAVEIAQRTRGIARQSVVVGMGLSMVAMVFAASGHIRPVVGAVLQEVIDVLVILNALRALGGPRPEGARIPEAGEVAAALASAHRRLLPHVADIAALAAGLDTLPPSIAREQLMDLQQLIERELLPHERAEQELAYPMIKQVLGSEDPTGPLIQTHHEIHRLSRLLSRLSAQLPATGPEPADLRDLRRVLYGLHAILTLHFAQEDELYVLLRSDSDSAAASEAAPPRDYSEISAGLGARSVRRR